MLNAAAAANRSADPVVTTGTVQLPEGWTSALGAAAYADDTIAAATTLASGPGQPLIAPGQDPDGAGAGPPLHPRVLWPWPHCVWVRRTALELVGGFDESLHHPGAVLTDFAARALANGLSCVLADDVSVRRTDDGPGPWPESDRRALLTRHPWIAAASDYQAALEPGRLRRAVAAADVAHRPISVTVDVRALGPGVGGTQAYGAALTLALARSGRVAVRALVAIDAPPALTRAIAEAGASLITYEEAVAGVRRTDVVHRPQQMFTAHDLRLAELVGDRTVVSQLDLISYRNPTYHATVEDWRNYRRTTRLTLGVADATVFLSEYSRAEAVAEELVESDRTTVAGIGVDPWASGDAPETRPAAVPEGQRFLLVLGADYAHKNRPFAIRLTDELRIGHGWDGLLVLAGPHQPHGSSASEEEALLRERPELARRVIDLGRVSDPVKRWLLHNAEAQILASTYEGFGLTLLESATVGRPCIYAPYTSLKEVVDPAAATIIPWDARASADAAASLLEDGDPRQRHLDLLSAGLRRHTWTAIVPELIACYERAIASPYRGGAGRVWAELDREERLTALADTHERVAFGRALIDRDDGLLTRAQQRGLMRVATRSWLRRSLLSPFGLLGGDDSDSSHTDTQD